MTFPLTCLNGWWTLSHLTEKMLIFVIYIAFFTSIFFFYIFCVSFAYTLRCSICLSNSCSLIFISLPLLVMTILKLHFIFFYSLWYMKISDLKSNLVFIFCVREYIHLCFAITSRQEVGELNFPSLVNRLKGNITERVSF